MVSEVLAATVVAFRSITPVKADDRFNGNAP
jgi:hypothetical protein